MDDMSAIGRVVTMSLKQKCSISEITTQISRLLQGIYHVKSFTENNMDLQWLVLSFGGPKLCYAVSKAPNLPSENLDSIHDTQVMWKSGKALAHRGFSLLIYEIALEQRPRYDADRDAVVGFSRFDAASCEMYNPTEETLGAMVDAICEGTLTRATEATVAAIAPFHPEFYTPVPLLISGTCKHEMDRLQSKWILDIVKTWQESPNGAAFYGPLWSIASDDFASLLRSVKGFLIADFHVSAIHLREKLQTLPEMDSTHLDALFNNKDHMNVPNAVSLHMGLYEVSHRINFQKCDPGDVPIALLGRLSGYLVRPFITPDMTLSQQLQSLSSAAHLFFVLFSKNWTSFCPGQLYYDIQSMIKNVFWSVAKQKILDPSGIHHIGLNGEDRLEDLYGIYRLKDNSRNVNILQLSERASTTAESCHIFAKHPDWDRGHRQLRLEGTEGVDHINPASWKADVSVANVSLLTSSNVGRRDVIELLKLLKISFDFAPLLNSDDVDLLRPLGNYVGLREGDIDFTMGWLDDDTEPVDLAPNSVDPPTCDQNGLEELEELLPAPGQNDLDSVRKQDRAWLTLKDNSGKSKHCHKASAVQYLLCTEDGLKSTDRLARVQGLAKIRSYSRNPPTPSLAGDDSSIGDLFLLNQLVATFIRVQNDVALAILRVTAIENERKTLLGSIPKSELVSDKVILRGQVLVLSLATPGTWDPKAAGADAPKSHWVWEPNSFESFNVSDGQVTKKSSIIEVPASLTRCVKGTLVPHQTGHCTWQFESDTLLALADFLWNDLKPSIKNLPSRKATSTFPCRDDKGKYLFVNSEGSAAVQAGPQEGHEACHLCLAEVELKRCVIMLHVILLRAALESRKNSNYLLVAAEKTTASGPSTNQPLRCELCHGSQPEQTQIRRREHVFWSYNLPRHIESVHPDKIVSNDFGASSALTDDELVNLKLKTGKGKGAAAKKGSKRKAGEAPEEPSSQRQRTE
ncbi:hypothetical protein FB451DRAFT_1193094 [Mycena latifolia]|nr:hypothetical protein FB451DRAFT_1193094 [Mycena latifolia]